MKTLLHIEGFIQTIKLWAKGQSDVTAVALVGSYARGTAKETSDIDIILIVDEPRIYLDDTKWIDHFGKAKKQQVEEYGLVTSLRAWYADGKEVEYGLTTRAWVNLPLDEGTQHVISDGMIVLYEKELLLSPFEEV